MTAKTTAERTADALYVPGPSSLEPSSGRQLLHGHHRSIDQNPILVRRRGEPRPSTPPAPPVAQCQTTTTPYKPAGSDASGKVSPSGPRTEKAPRQRDSGTALDAARSTRSPRHRWGGRARARALPLTASIAANPPWRVVIVCLRAMPIPPYPGLPSRHHDRATEPGHGGETKAGRRIDLPRKRPGHHHPRPAIPRPPFTAASDERAAQHELLRRHRYHWCGHLMLATPPRPSAGPRQRHVEPRTAFRG